MFPIIVLSRHKASIVFMGILVLIFLATSALAIVLAMAPLTTCGDPSYVEAHALTDNVQLRCQLVQAECALLWLGRCSFRDCANGLDLVAFIICSVTAFKGVKHYNSEVIGTI
jgi:hypothetical protein